MSKPLIQLYGYRIGNPNLERELLCEQPERFKQTKEDLSATYTGFEEETHPDGDPADWMGAIRRMRTPGKRGTP